MRKKEFLFGMVLAVISLLSVMPLGAAEEVNFISNGDFTSENNLKDPWQWRTIYCYMHNPNPEANKFIKDVRKAVKWNIKDGVASVVKPQEIVTICGEEFAQRASGAFSKFVKLADKEGGKYKFSMSYKAKNEGAGKNYLIFTYSEFGKSNALFSAKKVGKMKIVPVPTSPDLFSDFSTVIDVPKGADMIYLVIRIDGIGELDFTDTSLIKL